MRNMNVLLSSKNMCWCTPQDFYDKLNAEFKFVLDAAASDKTAKCSLFYTPETDGLSQSWNCGGAVFCNPPYGREIGKWVKKAYEESKCGQPIVLLIPARTDTSYFHNYIYGKAEIRFIRGRLRFTDDNGNSADPAPFPSMVVVYNVKYSDTNESLEGKMELIIDNFAGGGGASTGIELATGRPVDIAINHDPDAIAMHKINHPHTRHYCESVWDVSPPEICGGNQVGLMWLSPDCKHFSRAKGGKPVSKNVRGLAWIALRWAATARPRVIILENVPEFVTWGRLGKDVRPDPQHIGETFWSFVRALERHGYEVAWRELSACDYGAPTIRRRFFLVARCDGKPIVFPKATHGDGLIPYRTAAECIDWSIPCNSIFGREKPLAENTLRRIARGLDKFTIKAEKPFIMKYYRGIIGSDITAPLGTVTAIDHNALVTPSLIQYHSEQSGSEVRGQALDKPVMTVDASPRYALTAAHIVKYYSGKNHGSAVNSPLHTITTKDRNALIESHLCILRNNQDCKPLDEPMPTLCTSGGHISKIRTAIARYNPAGEHGNWAEVRGLLNNYCGYSLADDEILLLEINGDKYFISDIGMRMLEPRELYRAQGFPDDYIIDFDVNGKRYPRSAQVARCGNAVPPPFAEALVRANLPEMCAQRRFGSMRELMEAM